MSRPSRTAVLLPLIFSGGWRWFTVPLSLISSISQSGDAEVDAEEAIFLELIQTLLKDPAEREHFFQVSLPPSYVNVSLSSFLVLFSNQRQYLQSLELLPRREVSHRYRSRISFPAPNLTLTISGVNAELHRTPIISPSILIPGGVSGGVRRQLWHRYATTCVGIPF